MKIFNIFGNQKAESCMLAAEENGGWLALAASYAAQLKTAGVSLLTAAEINENTSNMK